MSRLVVLALLPVVAPLALLATGCSADDVPSTPVPGVPDGSGGDDSTTSSLPGPEATAPPNPDAGGGGPVASTP